MGAFSSVGVYCMSGYGTPPGTETTPLELDRLTALGAKPTYMEAKVGIRW